MGIISGLVEANIVYTTFIEGNEHEVNKFKTLDELKIFFDHHKRLGEVVGYVIVKNRTPGFKDYILTGKISIEWTDQYGYCAKEFEDVFDMAEFLKEHQILAESFGYKGRVKR